MKIVIVILAILVLLVTIGLNPVSKGVKGGAHGEMIHIDHVISHTLASLDSGSDGVGGFSFDGGRNSWFS